MKRIVCAVLVLVCLGTGVMAQTTDEVLHTLQKHRTLYRTGANAGFALSVVGAIFTPIGIGLVSTETTIQNLGYPNTGNYLTNINIAGQVFAGVGITSLIIGIIVWRDQEKRYMKMVNQEYRYREFINEQGAMIE